MADLRLCWSIFAIWYMRQGTTSHLVSAHMNGMKFGLVNGARCGVRNQTTHTVRNRAECALKCAIEECCSNFNFGFGQCELLSESAPCSTNATIWTHGYYVPGT